MHLMGRIRPNVILLFDLAAERPMATIADGTGRTVVYVTIAGTTVRVCRVTIGTARRIRVELMPQWEQVMKVIF